MSRFLRDPADALRASNDAKRAIERCGIVRLESLFESRIEVSGDIFFIAQEFRGIPDGSFGGHLPHPF
jgi:hypothetical protein